MDLRRAWRCRPVRRRARPFPAGSSRTLPSSCSLADALPARAVFGVLHADPVPALELRAKLVRALVVTLLTRLVALCQRGSLFGGEVSVARALAERQRKYLVYVEEHLERVALRCHVAGRGKIQHGLGLRERRGRVEVVRQRANERGTSRILWCDVDRCAAGRLPRIADDPAPAVEPALCGFQSLAREVDRLAVLIVEDQHSERERLESPRLEVAQQEHVADRLVHRTSVDLEEANVRPVLRERLAGGGFGLRDLAFVMRAEVGLAAGVDVGCLAEGI